MKRIILAFALFLLPSLASAQCTGVFPANTVCGVLTSGTPHSVPFASFPIQPVPYTSITGVPAHRFLGNNTGSTANAIAMTDTEATAELNVFTSSLQGLVPPSGGGTTNFLRADGAFAPAGGGIWNGTRLAKTAAYSAVSADCGDTIALGGGTAYAITLSAASGYTTTCAFIIQNEDTSRGKFLNINGLQGCVLWPQQTIMVWVSNNVWYTNFGEQCPTWKLSVTQSWTVDHVLGTDTVTCVGAVGGVAGNDKCPNDGLGTTTGAYALIQTAYNNIKNNVNCNGNAPSISNVNETFTEGLVLRGLSCPGYLLVNVICGGTCTWTAPNGGAAVDARDGAIIVVNNFTCVGGASGSICLVSSQGGVIDFVSMDFGTFANGYHMQIYSGGVINYNGGNYTVSGNMLSHIFMSGNSSFVGPSGGTVTVPNALTFTAWLSIIGPGYYLGNTAFSGTGSGAGSTGKKYDISQGGVANTGGGAPVLPGASAGTITTTGCTAGGCYN